MTSVRNESGITLIELCVAMVISMIVMGAVVSILTVFLHANRTDQFRDDATSDAQMLIDRMSRDLRSAASPTAGSSGLLAVANPYDIDFESVNATPGTAPTGNPTNHVWVRYCLDGNLTMWRQSTSPSSTSSTLPSTSACPSTASAWVTTSGGRPCCVQLSDVTNEIGGDTTRPLFTYWPSNTLSAVKSIQIDLFVDRNAGHVYPGPTEITSAVYLRNELAPPTASFVVAKNQVTGGTDVQLNGSLSSDPNGQVLSYQWYSGVGCPSPPTQAPATGAISGATTQQFDDGLLSTGSYTFALAVTNTGGLISCSSQSVAVP